MHSSAASGQSKNYSYAPASSTSVHEVKSFGKYYLLGYLNKPTKRLLSLGCAPNILVRVENILAVNTDFTSKNTKILFYRSLTETKIGVLLHLTYLVSKFFSVFIFPGCLTDFEYFFPDLWK